MNCVEIEILLQLAADGEVTSEEALLIENHLDQCVACRRKEAWLQQLETHLAVEDGLGIEEREALADAVVDALRGPMVIADAIGESESVSSPREAKRRKKTKKRGLFSRIVAMVWSRKKDRKAGEKRTKQPRNPSWIDASVGAMMPTPTSLDGFRAARQGVSTAVSGPIRAIRWVSGVTRIGRRRG